MARIYVCGEALIDFVPVSLADGDGFLSLPGGSPFNITKAAAQAGQPVGFLGALSTDIFGERLLADLGKHGVDTTLTPRSDDPSTLAFVDTSTGEPQYAFFDRQSAAANMDPTQIDVPAAPGDILAIGSISLIPQPAADNIVAFARSMSDQMMLAIDPNVRANMILDRPDWEQRIEALFDLCSIVKISSEDLEYLRPGQSHEVFAQGLLDRGVKLVVVTGGGEGALAMTANARCRSLARRVDVVDTVGAGDTFMGNLLAGLQRAEIGAGKNMGDLTDADLEGLLQIANAAAAINCTRKGCHPPTLSETTNYIEESEKTS